MGGCYRPTDPPYLGGGRHTFSVLNVTGHTIFGSERESDKVRILCGFLKNEELGLGGGEPLRLEQQVVHIAVAAATT